MCNTVELARQQAVALKRHTSLKIGFYVGEQGVDDWPRGKWTDEIRDNQVSSGYGVGHRKWGWGEAMTCPWPARMLQIGTFGIHIHTRLIYLHKRASILPREIGSALLRPQTASDFIELWGGSTSAFVLII